jgi:choline dehydrogenase
MTGVPAETDILVIGGGTGGAACAGLLAAHGAASVLLLEAGPDYGPRSAGRWPADLLDARCIPLSHDWQLNSGSTIPGRVLDFPRARVIGGCSAHNGCTAAVGARADYDAWAAAGNTGWDAETMAPLLEMARTRFRARHYTVDELTVAQAAFVQAGQDVGLPFADDLDTLEAGVGIGPMATNIVDRQRWNSAFAFLDPVRASPHLTISDHTTIDRLIVENGAVRGAIALRHGRLVTVRAERVVVCAGAYGTPAILLRSGIGPAPDLTRLDIPVVADLPGVGANLLDHPCTQMDYLGGAPFAAMLSADDWVPDEQSVARARSSRCDEGPYDIHVFLVAGANTGHPDLPPISIYGGAMKGRSAGRVTLTDTNPQTVPIIDPRYLSDDDGHDQAVLLEARELMDAITHQPEFARVIGPARPGSGAQLADTIVNYCHPAGTCKLGPASDPAAVVSHTGAVHGVDGLSIADASLMPTITRGNINLPTAAMAARVAAHVLDITPQELCAQAQA